MTPSICEESGQLKTTLTPASCRDATSPAGTQASSAAGPVGLFLSGLLIHVDTWMFFQTEAG